MAYIEVREKRDGGKSYKAEVVVTVDGKRHKRTATFSNRATANRWASQKERELRIPGNNEAFRKKHEPVTVADAVRHYLEAHRISLKATKKQVLGFVRDGRCTFSSIELRNVRSFHVRSFAEELAKGDRSPATVSSYLTRVCHVLSVAEDDFGPEFHIDLNALARGKASARRNGLAGKPNTRERRPSTGELDKLMRYFIKRSRGNSRALPMALTVAFAIFGLRRQSEITGLKWDDMNGEELMVRGMKDPRKPGGRDRVTELTQEAKRVIEIHGKRHDERIFPYSAGVISRNFTNACKVLDIKDLHFHDLRHEGVSLLREMGWPTGHVMLVSGHSATSTLDRYTNLKARGDKYADWQWWAELEKERYEYADGS